MSLRQPYEEGNTPKEALDYNEVSQTGKYLSDGLIKKMAFEFI